MRKDLKRAVALVRNGCSFGEAANKLGLTRNAVAGACNRAGVKSCNPPGDGSKSKRVAELYLKGLPYTEIARRCGLRSDHSVSTYLKHAGVAANRRARA